MVNEEEYDRPVGGQMPSGWNFLHDFNVKSFALLTQDSWPYSSVMQFARLQNFITYP